jgi:hypothetical protein
MGHTRDLAHDARGKPHPIDRVLHDGHKVELGGTTLVAHLTPGHMKVQDGQDVQRSHHRREEFPS